MNLTIRPANPADLEAVLALDEALFRFDSHFDPTLDPRWTRSAEGVEFFTERISRADGAAWVVEGDGVVRGYLCGVVLETESYRTVRRIAELECMFVEESLRGLGAGGKLAEAFMTWARGQGVTRAMVVACAANRNAVGFYRKMGFADFDLLLEREL